MVSRRKFIAGIASALPLFYVSPSFSQNKLELKTIVDLFPKLHSIQVKKGNDIVFSRMSKNYSLDKPANIKSCSKSLLGLFLGKALEQGIIANIKQPLTQLIPDLIPKGVTSNIANITLEELVTLTAPLQSTSMSNYWPWVNSKNWLQYTLTHPATHYRKGQMIYSTGTTHVLGIVLAEKAKKNLHILAQEYLGNPMGFDVLTWTKDPQGYYLGGNEMALTPKTMLDIATMVRDGGKFNNKQIIPKQWIDESFIPRTTSYWSRGYGYGWFLTRSGYMLARGYGGQIIAANIKKNIAVAITSNPFQPAKTKGYFGELIKYLDGPILRL